MTKQEALKRLCAVAGMVAEEKFAWTEAADCICDDPAGGHGNFQFSERVMEYIEGTIAETIHDEKSLEAMGFVLHKRPTVTVKDLEQKRRWREIWANGGSK